VHWQGHCRPGHHAPERLSAPPPVNAVNAVNAQSGPLDRSSVVNRTQPSVAGAPLSERRGRAIQRTIKQTQLVSFFSADTCGSNPRCSVRSFIPLDNFQDFTLQRGLLPHLSAEKNDT